MSCIIKTAYFLNATNYLYMWNSQNLIASEILLIYHSVQTNPAVYTRHSAVLDWDMKENWRSHDKKWQSGEIFPPHLKAVFVVLQLSQKIYS